MNKVDNTAILLSGGRLSNLLVLLPPANEVWGKVIFSQECVNNSVHRGRVQVVSQHALQQVSRRVPAPGESAPRGVPGGDPPGMATAAGGTHPTGMHSCIFNISSH